MHREVDEFILSVQSKYPEYFTSKKVLEVGSLDINGSVRRHFTGCDYTGIDVGPGKGVDLVSPIHLFQHPDEYDTLISTEMLEHDQYWQKSLQVMYLNLKKGGLLLLTCAGPNRQEHGTTRTTPGDAPFTNDYYRNISCEDFESILPKEFFTEYSLGLYRGDCDLYFYGIKK